MMSTNAKTVELTIDEAEALVRYHTECRQGCFGYRPIDRLRLFVNLIDEWNCEALVARDERLASAQQIKN